MQLSLVARGMFDAVPEFLQRHGVAQHIDCVCIGLQKTRFIPQQPLCYAGVTGLSPIDLSMIFFPMRLDL
ncbi:MAG: hypothetical protein SPD11_03700 [Sphaerochaetaceae bacterium]|nr:hypothetical protein [Sphaerochaetaceae bacterium]